MHQHSTARGGGQRAFGESGSGFAAPTRQRAAPTRHTTAVRFGADRFALAKTMRILQLEQEEGALHELSIEALRHRLALLGGCRNFGCPCTKHDTVRRRRPPSADH